MDKDKKETIDEETDYYKIVEFSGYSVGGGRWILLLMMILLLVLSVSRISLQHNIIQKTLYYTIQSNTHNIYISLFILSRRRRFFFFFTCFLSLISNYYGLDLIIFWWREARERERYDHLHYCILYFTCTYIKNYTSLSISYPFIHPSSPLLF